MSQEDKESTEAIFMKRFQSLLQEEFSTLTVGEVLQILMTIYLNLLNALEGPTFKDNARFGHNLFRLGCKRFAEKLGEEDALHWGNVPEIDDLHFVPSRGDG